MKTKKLLIGFLAGVLLLGSADIRALAAETTETETVVDSTITTTTETALEATDTETTDTNTEVTLTEEEKIAAEKEAAEKAAEEKKAEEAKAKAAAEKKTAAKKAALKKKQTAEYNKQVKYLAALIYTEAGNQPYKGKVAVANVVLNRVGSKKITAEKIRDVIYAPNQFSVVRNGSFERALNNYNDFDSAQEKDCIKAAKAALEGKNYVGGREYFTRYTRSLASSYPSGVKIGDHYFW